ncbi:MAG: hypothetical protein WCG16_03940 [Methylococcales bacterium]
MNITNICCVPDKQAEAEAEALSEALEVNFKELVTKEYLDTKFQQALAPIRTDLAVLKWMIGLMSGCYLARLKSIFLTEEKVLKSILKLLLVHYIQQARLIIYLNNLFYNRDFRALL